MNDWLETRIKSTLEIYPGISPSMLQLSLGAPAAQWKPLLEELITLDKVKREAVIVDSTARIHTCVKLFWVE